MAGLSRRAAKREAKIAVLNMLEELARGFMVDARYDAGQGHDDLVTRALASNELKDQLAAQWRLVRVGD